ncbi:MAG: hypothetical protein IJA26_07215 [Clostridia bacterium]|nr:hypothetical protein [Clostridia bacterium]
MTIKKLLCIVFALVMALGCVAFAEEDLQAQLDAANARIAELEAQVETYYPFYEAQIAATYGEDGVVWVEDILNQYAYVDSQYAGMGMSLESLGMGAYMKQELVSVAVETGVLLDKEAELGLGVVTEEFIAEAEAAADKVIEEYIGYYMDYTYPDVEEITDEMRAEAIAYWADNGLDKESYVESSKQDAITSAMYEYAVKDVVITEEDVQAEYEAMVAANKEDYAADPGSYASDLTSGALIAYHPEGFRMVKQVLVQFDEDQSALYSQLQTRLSSLNAEKEALAAGEAVEGEQRTAAEIDSDIQACAMEIEALYAQLMPEVEEVIEKFNNGTDIETLIAEHNDDPGMMQGITAETGYAVSEGCTNWDPAFKDAAMSIEEIGQLSAPAYGSYGIYIVYYLSDVVPGEVDLETIRADVEYNALENKRTAAYDAALAQWVEEAGVVYHFENLGI